MELGLLVLGLVIRLVGCALITGAAAVLLWLRLTFRRDRELAAIIRDGLRHDIATGAAASPWARFELQSETERWIERDDRRRHIVLALLAFLAAVTGAAMVLLHPLALPFTLVLAAAKLGFLVWRRIAVVRAPDEVARECARMHPVAVKLGLLPVGAGSLLVAADFVGLLA